MNNLISAVIFAICVMIGLWYISGVKAQLATSEANNVTLKNTIETQYSTIESLQVDIIRVNELKNRLVEVSRKQDIKIRKLREKLSSHDMNKIALKKPLLLEKLINKTTVKVNKCFEIITAGDNRDCEKSISNSNN